MRPRAKAKLTLHADPVQNACWAKTSMRDKQEHATSHDMMLHLFQEH